MALRQSRRWGVAVLLLAPLLVPLASANAVSGDGDYDTFDANTFNDVVNGTEVPYASGAAVQYDTPTFDTSAFDIQAADGESTSDASNINGCITDHGTVFVGRSAWVRFNPGVDGSMDVLATTIGYDSLLIVRGSNKVTFGTAHFSDLSAQPLDWECRDSVVSNGSEQINDFPVKAALDYYVLVGGKCPGDASTCQSPAIQGGNTQIRLVFTPDDTDSDGVPDTKDSCPGTPAGVRVNAAGCPDQDGDAIADSEDDCKTVPGVPAAHPFNGCPAGPTPPGGTADVLITSLDGDTNNTNDIHVRLRLDWPQGAQQAFADNGDGQPPQPIDFAHAPVDWWLSPANKSETRQVNVRFLGPGINETDSDIITLDPVAPTVPHTLVIPPQLGDWYIGAVTADDRSGVRSFTVLDKHRKVIGKPVVCKKKCLKFDGYVTSPARTPRYLMVVDNAGNVSKMVKLDVPRSACKYTLSARSPSTGSRCFRLGTTCTSQDVQHYNFALARLSCKRGVVVKARSV